MAEAPSPSDVREAAPERERAMLARRERLLGPAYRLLYAEPVHVVRGSGVWLEDAAGARYLDAYNNVPAVGHGHPRVVEAVGRQWATLNTHTRYLHEAVLDYAEALLATLPPHLDRAMFTCTGSEANDLAYRIAQHRTGATGVVVTASAYHGVTDAVSKFSPSLGPSVPLGAHVRAVPAPDGYRRDPGTLARDFAADVEAAIADLRAAGFGLAAFFCDSVFSSDGVFADPAGFLAPAAAAAQAAGGLYVADEVQAGFGRLGDGLWGFARHGVEPDMVTLGKPMGNGQPVAGVAMRAALAEDFGRRGRYFNTFGGNPVSCAAAQAVLDVIRDEDLVGNARRVGARLLAGLRGLAARHPLVGDVRGAGLYAGVEIVADRATKAPDGARAARIVDGMRRRRVLIGASGPGGNVLKIRPPLVFSAADVDALLDAAEDALRAG